MELSRVYKSLKTISALVEKTPEEDSPMQVESSSSTSSVEMARQDPKPEKSSASKKKKILDSALASAHDARLPSKCQNGKIKPFFHILNLFRPSSAVHPVGFRYRSLRDDREQAQQKREKAA